jgi:DNA-binding MarR family transcriptional regulator
MNTKKETYQQLREMVRKLERFMGNLDESENSCCGISTCQCHALVEIGRTGGISLEGLSKRLELDNSTISRTVNALVTCAFAKRKIDTKDRRYITIKLTEKGKKVYQDIETNMDQYFEKVYGKIPEEKRKEVLESFDLVLKAIQKAECCQI